MKATFFNQPWLARKYPPGTRLVLHGKYAAPQRLSRHEPRADRRVDRQRRARSPTTRPPRGCPRRRSSRSCAPTWPPPSTRSSRCRRGRGCGAGCPDRPAALVAAHAGDHEGGRRRLAFDELLLAQLSLLRRRAQRRSSGAAPVLDGAPSLTRRWREELLPFALTGDQARAIADARRGARLAAADAAPAHGGGRLGQDRRRAARDAARRRARHAGGLHGADRDARRAALRDAAGADARRGGARGAADRLDDGFAAHATR